jgi:hypothetical protein
MPPVRPLGHPPVPVSTPPAPPSSGGCTPVSLPDGVEDAGADSVGGEAGGGEVDVGGAVGVLSSGGGGFPSGPGDASSGDGSAASPPKPVPGNPVVASSAAAASRDPSGLTRDFAGSTLVPASAVGSLWFPVLPFAGSVAAPGDVGRSVRTITSSAPLPGSRKSFALQPMSAPMSAPIAAAPVSVAAMRRKAWPRPANPLGRRGRARSLPRNPPAEPALAVASASRSRSSSATCARVPSRSHRTAGAVGSGRGRWSCTAGSSIPRRRAISDAVRKRCWFLFVLLP